MPDPRVARHQAAMERWVKVMEAVLREVAPWAGRPMAMRLAAAVTDELLGPIEGWRSPAPHLSAMPRTLSHHEVVHYLVDAVEAATDYQALPDEFNVVWAALTALEALGSAREHGRPDPPYPTWEGLKREEALVDTGQIAPRPRKETA